MLPPKELEQRRQILSECFGSHEGAEKAALQGLLLALLRGLGASKSPRESESAARRVRAFIHPACFPRYFDHYFPATEVPEAEFEDFLAELAGTGEDAAESWVAERLKQEILRGRIASFQQLWDYWLPSEETNDQQARALALGIAEAAAELYEAPSVGDSFFGEHWVKKVYELAWTLALDSEKLALVEQVAAAAKDLEFIDDLARSMKHQLQMKPLQESPELVVPDLTSLLRQRLQQDSRVPGFNLLVLPVRLRRVFIEMHPSPEVLGAQLSRSLEQDPRVLPDVLRLFVHSWLVSVKPRWPEALDFQRLEAFIPEPQRVGGAWALSSETWSDPVARRLVDLYHNPKQAEDN